MKKTPIGQRIILVTLQNPGPGVSDGDGGTTQSWFSLTPATVFAAIRPPTGQDLERLAAGTVISTGMRVLTFPFHPQVTVSTRAIWLDPAGRSHVASVTGVDNPEERCIETVCLCVELLDVLPDFGLDGGDPGDLGIDGGTPTSVFTGTFDGGTV